MRFSAERLTEDEKGKKKEDSHCLARGSQCPIVVFDVFSVAVNGMPSKLKMDLKCQIEVLLVTLRHNVQPSVHH